MQFFNIHPVFYIVKVLQAVKVTKIILAVFILYENRED